MSRQSQCVGRRGDLNPIKQPHMFWLLKVLIFYSDKLNNIEWCVLGLKSPRPHLHVCLFFSNLRMEWLYFIQLYRPFIRCWFLPSGLNCESNHCSLCLCVRLCWGRGALWGTLDSQVTWLDSTALPFLLPLSTFILFISAKCSPQHPCLPILCTKHPRLPLC